MEEHKEFIDNYNELLKKSQNILKKNKEFFTNEFELQLDTNKLSDDLNYIALAFLEKQDYKFGKNFLGEHKDRFKIFNRGKKLVFRDFKKHTTYKVVFISQDDYGFKHTKHILELLSKEVTDVFDEIITTINEYHKGIKKKYQKARENSYYNRTDYEDININIYEERINVPTNTQKSGYGNNNGLFLRGTAYKAVVELKNDSLKFKPRIYFSIKTKEDSYIHMNDEDERFMLLHTNTELMKVFDKCMDKAEKAMADLAKKRSDTEQSIHDKLIESGVGAYLMLRDV